jgi:hypothetical protein
MSFSLFGNSTNPDRQASEVFETADQGQMQRDVSLLSPVTESQASMRLTCGLWLWLPSLRYTPWPVLGDDTTVTKNTNTTTIAKNTKLIPIQTLSIFSPFFLPKESTNIESFLLPVPVPVPVPVLHPSASHFHSQFEC